MCTEIFRFAGSHLVYAFSWAVKLTTEIRVDSLKLKRFPRLTNSELEEDEMQEMISDEVFCTVMDKIKKNLMKDALVWF